MEINPAKNFVEVNWGNCVFISYYDLSDSTWRRRDKHTLG